MNQVVVFQTSKRWQFDTAWRALKDANVPFFKRYKSEFFSRFGYSLLVPEENLDEAKQILSELPIELDRGLQMADQLMEPSEERVRLNFKILLVSVVLLVAILLVARACH